MVFLIQPSPFKTTHFSFYFGKYTGHPINHTTEILFQLGNIFIKTMTAHIVSDIALTCPIERTFQKILPVSATRYIRAPFLDIGILAITKLLLAKSYKWSRIHSIEQLLRIKWNTGNIYSPKPLFYLAFCAFAFINEKFCFQNLSLLVFCYTAKILLHAVFVFDGKFVSHKTSNTGDPLLPVQDLQIVFKNFIKIDQAYRVTFEY